MPLLKKKVHTLAPIPEDIKTEEELFVITETGECYRTYDEYIDKVFFYGSKVWSCEYSGHTGLTYKEAMESEKTAMKQLKDFPEFFKEPLLRTIHQGQGRLIDILENCSKKLKTEYFLQEEVYVSNSKYGKKCFGVIVDVSRSTEEKIQSNVVIPDKENEQSSAQKENIEYKYNIQLKGSDVILTDISFDNMRRKTKLPTKDLLKLFLKSSAEKFDVKGNGMWLTKNELIMKYHLPVVSKEKPKSSEQKTSVRNPLYMISGPNDESVPKKNGKSSLKKSPNLNNNSTTQRTLMCFLKEDKNERQERKVCTPMKEKTMLFPEIKVHLTPTKKQKEAVESDKPVKQNKKGIEKNSEAGAKMDQGSHQDCVSQNPVQKFNEISQKQSKSQKKQGVQTITFVPDFVSSEKDGESSCNKLMNDVIIYEVDEELCEKDKMIVKKNTVKKQKTIMEMLKCGAMKKQAKEEVSQSKELIPVKQDNVLTQPPLHRELNELEKEKMLQARLKAATLYDESELDLQPLHSPKPVPVPDELSQYYGDVLMITEFIYTYSTFITQEKQANLTPDKLITALMSKTGGFHIISRILIDFIRILLNDLRGGENEKTKKPLVLDVELFDVPLTKETIVEVTRAYLELDQKKTITKQRLTLSLSILAAFGEKEFVEFSPSEKLEVLTCLLQRVAVSDIFYDHVHDINEQRRQNWVENIKEVQERNNIQKKLEEMKGVKKGQKEINMFLVKDQMNDTGEKTLTSEVRDDPSIVSSPLLEETTTCNDVVHNLTKRQELIAEKKIEKEKEDEIQCLEKELYEKNVKITSLKQAIQEAVDSRRVAAFGIDRNNTRYWMFPSYPVGLFAEKMCEEALVDSKQELEKDKDAVNVLERKEKVCWFYYDSINDIKKLIKSLCNKGLKESNLRFKLRKRFTEIKKNYVKRTASEETKNGEEEDYKDPLLILKEEFVDLATRVTNGLMGDVADLEMWVDNVNNCSSASGLVSYFVELGSSVRVANFSKHLKNPKEWLNAKWIPAVQQAETTSRLHFLLILLDCCIKWEECTLYMKCKICRKNGGTMVFCQDCHKGYHKDCLRSPVDEESLEQWLCPCCKAPVSKRQLEREENENESSEDDEEEEEEEDVNENFCDVCGGHGDLICCDSCPKVYHKQCHDPPMRNIPRGIWNCCQCKNVTKKCYLDEDSSDSCDYSKEEEPIPEKRTKRTVTVKSTKESIISENKRLNVTRKRRYSPSEPEEEKEISGKRKSRQDPELKKCEDLLKDLVNHEESWPFLGPVDLSEVPDYVEVVSCPIDFGTIRKKLDGLEYTIYKELLSDIELVFSNSDKYNLNTSDHGQAGCCLEAYFKEILPSYFPEYQIAVKSARNTWKLKRNRKNH